MLVLGPDDEDEPLVEIGADGTVLNQQPWYRVGARQAQADEEPWCEVRRCCERSRGRESCPCGIEPVVEEVEMALTREALLVRQRHADRELTRAPILATPLLLPGRT